ncbi:LacI family DNA-binding transcriptional regulator [Microbacterium sp.]|uniref:LacI family DNA-binding transcriptional regulator n=1 Tax=Microbacterium sp. TaxID=51671 RepID=UPI002E35E6A8|nr:LacI family DNA-binding transcriptional regulator [Microbacterium sp.]HEX5729930.1 LacI family DNA-binding transcriptional regulator [Microbacterium sp.]
MVGIEDVARGAGVSVATVSRALSGRGSVADHTRERVLLVAHELGYVVSSAASGLASGRSRAVGVIVPLLNRWFYTSVLEAAQNALVSSGYDLTLYNLGGGADRRGSVFEEFLHRGRVDGFIAISLEVNPEEVRSLHAVGKPIVCVGGPIAGLHTLSVDDVEMARLATEHLASLGHRRIALIGGSPGQKDFHMPLKRKTGYELALTHRGIDLEPALLEEGYFTIETGYEAATRLLADPSQRPTAIFAASDEMAVGAILAARELGLRVPEHLSVAGIDDHELAGFFGLTTVAQYPAAQGARAVELLLSELEGDGGIANGEGNTPHPFDLIVRSSTGPPPRGS